MTLPRRATPGLRTLFVTLVAGTVAALSAPPAHAQFTWTQPYTGASTNWSTGPWTQGVPTSGTTTVLTFNVRSGSPDFLFANDLGAVTVNGLNFNQFGSNLLTLDLGNNPLTIGGTNPFLTNNGPGNVTITGAGGVTLNANTTLTGSGNGTVTIESVIAGTGGLVVNQTGLGILSLMAANSFAGGVTLTGGVLGIGAGTSLGTGTLTVNGGLFRSAGTFTAANAVTLNADLVSTGGGGVVTLSGLLSGAGGLRLQGYNSANGLTLSAANPFTGPTVLQSFIPNTSHTGPTLTLTGANGALAATSAVTVGRNTTLSIGAAGTNANRVNDAAPVTMTMGRINFVPTTAGTTETLGNLTVNGVASFNTTPTGVSTLQFGTLTRNDNGVLWFDSPSFGLLNSATTATLVKFSNVTAASANVSAGAGTQIGIIPWAIGSSSTNPRSFLSYDDTNGMTIVPFDNATLVTPVAPGTLSAALTNQNVRLNGAGNYDLAAGSLTVNAVTTNSSTVQILNGTLTIASGVFVNFDTVVWGNGAVMGFGANRGFYYSSWNNTFTGTSSITGSNGLVVTGMGVNGSNNLTFQNTTGNPFTGGLWVNGNVQVGFRQDDQLGAAGGAIFLGGGRLAYNAAADLTVPRAITLGPAGGGFSFNVTALSGATAGNATANTNLTLSGLISGSGALTKEGIGVVTLTGANTYTGGTVVSAGTLQFAGDGNLGTGKITLNGGTIRPSATTTITRAVELNADSGIQVNTGVTATFSAPLTTIGHLYGTANPTLTKSGAGTLVLAAVSPLFSGNLAIAGGTVDLTGTIPQVQTVVVGTGATFLIDNAGAYASNRLSDLAMVSFDGGFASYVAPNTATGATAEQVGPLRVTAANSVFSVTGGTASPTVIRFTNLDVSTGSITLRGDDLGGTTGNYTRIFFDSAPVANGAIIPNVFYAATAGTGTSTTQAQWDSVRGVIPFSSTPVTGILIDNFAPTSTPLNADFTTTGAATAKTGASIFRLTLDGGTGLTLTGGNPADPLNANTPDGTFVLSSGQLIAQNGAKSIDSAVARTLSFGTAPAIAIQTASDLTLAANVTLAGNGAVTKLGAGNLTVSGPYAITGPLTVSAGTITFGTAATVGDLSGAGTVALGTNPLVINQTGSTTFAGALTGGTTVTKGGPGTLTFSPSNTPAYAGGTQIADGTLRLGSVGGATVVFVGGIGFGSAANTSGILDLNGFSTPGALTAVPPIVGTGTGHQVINSNAALAATLTLNLTADAVVPMALGGNLIVNKNDANVLTLTGTAQPAATTNGVINVNAGTLVLASGVPVSPGMSFTAAAGATMSFGTFGNNNSDAGAFGSLTVTGGAAKVTGGAGDLAIRTVTLTGGSLDFTGTNNFFWHFRNAGAAINTLAAATTATFVQGASTTSRIQNDTASPLVITVAAGTTPSGIDFDNGILMSAGGTNSTFVKAGPGVMRLNNPNSTATFQVNAGILRVDSTGGSGTGPVAVNAGGTLGGIGTVNGPVTANPGGAVGPGASVGTLTVANTVTLNAAAPGTGAVLDIEVSRTGIGTANNDLLVVTGAANRLNFAGLAAGTPGAGDNKFRIRLLNDTANPMIAGESYSLVIAQTPGVQRNGTGVGTAYTFNANDYQLFSPNFSAFNSASLIVDASNNLVLAFVPVPEPATILGLAALGLIAARARRKPSPPTRS